VKKGAYCSPPAWPLRKGPKGDEVTRAHHGTVQFASRYQQAAAPLKLGVLLQD
jgi:hypothetical protein